MKRSKSAQIYAEYELDDERSDFMLDEVTGKKRKPVMAVLNKTKLSKYEMDELFL